MSIDRVLDALRCPVCTQPLRAHAGSVRCASRHTFDVAREGYVNLLTGKAKASTADTGEMVAARRDFLAAGPFDPLIEAVAQAVSHAVDDDVPGVVLDAGGGTGAYLSAALDRMPDRRGLLLDISKLACRAAAKALPDAGVVVADVWRPLPVRDRGAAVVLDVFAPRNAAEFHRVLHREGALVVVTPTALHLESLVSRLGLVSVDPRKLERLAEKLDGLFDLEDERLVTAELALTRPQALTAALMGPSAAHVEAQELAARIETVEEPFLTVLSARIGVYRPRQGNSLLR